MSSVTYEIVEHDGGWAYRVNGIYSETFGSRELARRAAHHAAREQKAPGESIEILYEDEKGKWRREESAGNDRPDTDVKG